MAIKEHKQIITDDKVKKLNKQDGAKLANILAMAISQANQVNSPKPKKK